MSATQEEIDYLANKIKAALIEKGFEFGTFSPDYAALGAEAYAKVIIEQGSGSTSDIDWELVDVETMMALISNEIIHTEAWLELKGGLEDILGEIYDSWDNSIGYSDGDRVLFDGIFYQASGEIEGVNIGVDPDTLPIYWLPIGTFENITTRTDNIETRITTLQESSADSVNSITQINLTLDGDANSTGLSATVEEEKLIRAISLAPDWNDNIDYEDKEVIVYGTNIDDPSQIQLWQNMSGGIINSAIYNTWELQAAEGFWVPISKNLFSQYSVKVESNGVISGFVLASDGAESSFLINADTFAISPSNSSAEAEADGTIPFIVQDGITYIKTAFIKDLSADNFVANTIVATSLTMATGIEDSVDYFTLQDITDHTSTMANDMLVLATNSGEFVSALPGIEDGIVNFNARNDRIIDPVQAPTIDGTGLAIDYVFNHDRTANVVFTWEYPVVLTAATNIDGFILYIKVSPNVTPEVIDIGNSENIKEYQYFNIEPTKRSIRIFSLSTDKYYTIGIEAYRIVDQDLVPNGIIRSSIIQPTFNAGNPDNTGENPFYLGEDVPAPTSVTVLDLDL